MVDETELEEIREAKRDELREELTEDAGEAAPDAPVSVADADDLEDLVERHGTVLVDFYADWCGPCKTMEPVVERLAAETDAAVAKVDIDAAGALARDHGVRSVPTFLIFSDGEPAQRFVGALDGERLRAALD